MSQPPNPYNPYGDQPGSDATGQPGADQSVQSGAPNLPVDPEHAQASGATSADAPGAQGGGAASDPALHPHDPFAAGPGPTASADSNGGYGAPSGGHSHQTGGFGAAGGPSGGYGAAGGQTGANSLDVPPPGFKGVHEGPLTGQPLNDSDAKTWALVVHLSALLQFVIPLIGGLIAQIALFVLFKDRHRFVRYNAAEALNGTIAALIVSLAMGAIFTVITIVTFGIGAFLFGLMFIPTAVQAIFAIIGAVKSYQGEWWNYPVNIRLVK